MTFKKSAEGKSRFWRKYQVAAIIKKFDDTWTNLTRQTKTSNAL